MDYHRKRTIATGVLIVAIGLTFWGFQRIQAEAFSGHLSGFTKVVFFGAAIVGVSAAVARTYLGVIEKQDLSGQKIAMDTMGKLGQQKLEEKRKKQS